MAVNFKTKKDIGPRINEQIIASEVRLISSSGKQMGILSIREALIQAEDEGFDLVEVSPEANPPVCKIIDYGKLKYEMQIKIQVMVPTVFKYSIHHQLNRSPLIDR